MLGTSTEFPSRTEQIIDGRNQRFRERMRPFLEEGRAAVFVGSAHMLQLRDMLAEGVPHVAAQAPRRDQGQEWRLAGKSGAGRGNHSPQWGNAIFRHWVKSNPRNG